MTTLAPAAGLTSFQIACAIPLPYFVKHSGGTAYVESLLLSERRGHVEQDGRGRWRSTEATEREFGAALRGLA